MDFSFILPILEQFGVIGAFLIIAGILIFKFGDRYLTKLAERLAEGKIPSHKKKSQKLRKESIQKMNRLIRELMNKLEADRAAVFEYHNGGANLSGFPFIHFTLVLQQNRLGVDELSKDFDNVLVSSVPDFVNDLDKNVLYHIKDIAKLEYTYPRLYKELVEDEMKEVIFCRLDGQETQIGFVMLAFKKPIKVSMNKVTKEFIKKTQKLSIFLDGSN